MVNTMFFHEEGGMVYKLADAWNVGIIVFSCYAWNFGVTVKIKQAVQQHLESGHQSVLRQESVHRSVL